jgi:hypothetical protein
VRGLPRVSFAFAPIVAALIALGCGRTALEPTQPATADAGGVDHPRDLPAEHTDGPPDLLPDKQPDRPTCIPTGSETCNGVDDDCNGVVDDNVQVIPCPGGGVRQCVGGAYSDCPRRCEVCVPGSKRTCITSFCTFWGNQECTADGMSFGPCKEAQPPPACADVASQMQRSPELEKCCIRNGYCCVDEFDLDGDGDRTEMMGRCESIVCE